MGLAVYGFKPQWKAAGGAGTVCHVIRDVLAQCMVDMVLFERCVNRVIYDDIS